MEGKHLKWKDKTIGNNKGHPVGCEISKYTPTMNKYAKTASFFPPLFLGTSGILFYFIFFYSRMIDIL